MYKCPYCKRVGPIITDLPDNYEQYPELCDYCKEYINNVNIEAKKLSDTIDRDVLDKALSGMDKG